MTIKENKHNRCQKCLKIRRFIIAFSCVVLAAVISEQAGFSREVTLSVSFLAAIIPLMWFGKHQ